MLIAATYARRSNDERERHEDNKSVTRQSENARAYAESKGYSVPNDAVFVDDNVSGAEYQNRPGLHRLLSQLDRFDALILSEPSRLGRDMTRTNYYLADILEHRVRVFYYLTDDEETADTPEQKMVMSLRAYAGEVERQKASQRSRDALQRKAKKGYVTGGVVYGYDNEPVLCVGPDGQQLRSHTEHRINPEEAEIVRTIFRMYSDGHGFRMIALTLNGDPGCSELNTMYLGGKRPASPSKGTGSWAPSSIRSMLYNARYIGKITYGRHRKMYRLGTQTRERQENCLEIDRPDLAIVPLPLWQAVQKRLQEVREHYRNLNGADEQGRSPSRRASRYLLSGLTRCAECGGNMVVIGAAIGGTAPRRYHHYYICSTHHNRGSTVCGNDHRVRIELLDGPVVEAIRQSVLSPEAVEYTIEKAVALAQQRRQAEPERPKAVRTEIAQTKAELQNFVALIANGQAPETVLREIAWREQRIKVLKEELHRLKAPAAPAGRGRGDQVRAVLRERLDDLYGLLKGDVPGARKALLALLPERITLTPAVREGRKVYRFEGQTPVGALIDKDFIKMASPRGVEPLSPP